MKQVVQQRKWNAVWKARTGIAERGTRQCWGRERVERSGNRDEVRADQSWERGSFNYSGSH